MAELKIPLAELKNFIVQNKTLMEKMDPKVKLSVVNHKLKIGILPLNKWTVNLLEPVLKLVLNLVIKKGVGIKGVSFRNIAISDGNILIELDCAGTSELEIASSNEK